MSDTKISVCNPPPAVFIGVAGLKISSSVCKFGCYKTVSGSTSYSSSGNGTVFGGSPVWGQHWCYLEPRYAEGCPYYGCYYGEIGSWSGQSSGSSSCNFTNRYEVSKTGNVFVLGRGTSRSQSRSSSQDSCPSSKPYNGNDNVSGTIESVINDCEDGIEWRISPGATFCSAPCSIENGCEGTCEGETNEQDPGGYCLGGRWGAPTTCVSSGSSQSSWNGNLSGQITSSEIYGYAKSSVSIKKTIYKENQPRKGRILGDDGSVRCGLVQCKTNEVPCKESCWGGFDGSIGGHGGDNAACRYAETNYAKVIAVKSEFQKMKKEEGLESIGGIFYLYKGNPFNPRWWITPCGCHKTNICGEEDVPPETCFDGEIIRKANFNITEDSPIFCEGAGEGYEWLSADVISDFSNANYETSQIFGACFVITDVKRKRT